VLQDEGTVLMKQHVVVLIIVRGNTVRKGEGFRKAKPQLKKTRQRKIGE